MSVVYYKRFRMEIALAEAPVPPELPVGYRLAPWHESLLEWHADVKYLAFHEEIDAVVFSSLGCRPGCEYLMRTICAKPNFIPAATWLVLGPEGPCATVQGLSDRAGSGAIQNLGVVPTARGRGLGSLLLLKALEGFRRAGLRRAYLEVTARNEGAVRLYRRLGFRFRKTIYKAVEVMDASAQPVLL